MKADAIAAAGRYAPKPCKQCGETFTPERNKTIKSQSCVADNHASTRRAKKQQERAQAKGLPGARYDCFDPYEIFERDGWECQLCGKETPKALRGLNLLDSPELDHIVCLHAGGDHTKENTQCLCRRCNVAKSAEDAEEGVLIGVA
ncbi:HNH endonuclease [Agrobacterium deltaense]|uniref:HNH endonuclease n=1 Tax=Agrobacterium deltaense TaxID=1183412 RepID=UPI001C6E601A|nr:HNH endonuclease [Agrobacterium deltaense]MBW9074942.1 HNH endonuclease [Agrobacterium deltaense]